MVKALPIIAGLLAASGCLGIATQSALAEEDDVASKLHACASIRSDIDRLGCYDKAFGQHVATPATSQPQMPAPQTPAVAAKKPTNDSLTVSEDQTGWSNKETISGLDNSKTETAILPAATAKISRFAAGVSIEAEYKGTGLGAIWSTPESRSAYMGEFNYQSEGTDLAGSE